MPNHVDVKRLFDEACAAEARARRSPDDVIKHGPTAVEKFLAAAQLSDELARDHTIPEEERVQHRMYGLYYSAHGHKQRANVLYEQRDVEASLAEQERASGFLAQAMANGEQALSTLTGSARTNVAARLRNWQSEQMTFEAAVLAAKARRAWDSRDWIAGLDLYRSILEKEWLYLENMKAADASPSDLRITFGNVIGATINCSQALAMITSSGIGRGLVACDAAMDLLRHTFDAYQMAGAAMDANPEWQQFREGRAQCQKNIERFLEDNRGNWAQIIIEFEDAPEFLKIMKATDADTYNRAKERLAPGNKVVTLWAVGGFWLLVLLIVGAGVLTVYRLTGLWTALGVVAGTEVLLLIIGALVLRTIGELSEAGFIKAVGIAARFQLRWLSTLLRSHRAEKKN